MAEAITTTSPGELGDVLLDSLVGFEPGPGEATIEPGTANEETFSYNGIGDNPTRLFGVSRPNPLDHPAAAVVQPAGAETASSPASEGSSTGGDAGIEPGSNGSGSTSEGPAVTPPTETTDDAVSSVTEPGDDPTSGAGTREESLVCTIIEQQTGTDYCGLLIGPLPLPDSCRSIDPNHLPLPILECVTDLGDIDLIDVPELLCNLNGLFCQIPPDPSFLCPGYNSDVLVDFVFDCWNEPIPEYATPDRTDVYDMLPHPNPPKAGPQVFGDLEELHSQIEDTMPTPEIDAWGLGENDGDKKCTITAAAPHLDEDDGITVRGRADFECDKKREVSVRTFIQYRAAKTWWPLEDSLNERNFNAKQGGIRTHGKCRPPTEDYRVYAAIAPINKHGAYIFEDSDRSPVVEISCRPNE